MLVVAVTPFTLFLTWKRLRHILWMLPVAARAYTLFGQLGL